MTWREGRDAFGRKINPCLSLYGPGPEGVTCRKCARLTWSGNERRYSKCTMRCISGGAATDHSVNFPACGKYEEAS
jgi:hypothetical protein